MKAKSSAQFLGGACAIYVAMAACGASSDRSASSIDASARTGLGDSSAIDALTNPVTEAAADPIVDVAQETCGPIAGQATGIYAQHQYPGKTLTELTAVRVTIHYTATGGAGLPALGYADYQVSAFIKDGAALAACPVDGAADYVTFTLAE